MKKKYLLISNIITLVILVFLISHYRIPNKIYNRIWPSKIVNNQVGPVIENQTIICSYELRYFNFHFQDEPEDPNIIMFGNSLIKQRDWNQLLTRGDVWNRGIAGDNIPCMAQRTKYLNNTEAKIWFIEGGINDVPWRPTEIILSHYKTIVDSVKARGAIPVVHLVNYLSPKVVNNDNARKNYKMINDSIFKLNKLIENYAKEENISYIDLNQVIAEDNVTLDQFTTDGVHLTDEGYSEWAKLIQKILDEKNI